MRRLLMLAAVIVLAAPLAFAGGKAAAEEEAGGLGLIDWNKPVSMYERVASAKYTLPEGWKEAIGDTKELTFINSGPLQYDPAMAEGMEIFTKLTGIKLNAIEISEELLHTKQSAMMRARSDKLDLVFTTLSTEAYYDYQAAGWLEPCDLLYDDQVRTLYSDDMLEAMTIDGKLWGFPYIGGAFVYGYRKDIFEKEGLTPPKTWDELLVVAKKLTKDGMYGFAFPAGPSYDTYGIFCSFLSGAGGELLEGDKVVVNSPEAVEALQVMVDLRNKYKVVPEGVNTYSLQQMGELLAAGRIASFVSTSWTYQFIINTDMWENFAMTLYPAKSGVQQTVYQDTSFYSVSPFSKNKAAAYLFLDFLRSYEERKLELLVERNVIYNREVWKDPDINEESVPFYQTIKAAVDRAKIYVFPNSQKIVDLLNVAVEKALSGSVTPKEALDEVQTKVDILQF